MPMILFLVPCFPCCCNTRTYSYSYSYRYCSCMANSSMVKKRPDLVLLLCVLVGYLLSTGLLVHELEASHPIVRTGAIGSSHTEGLAVRKNSPSRTNQTLDDHNLPALSPWFRPKIYEQRGSWDNAPIVVQEYKLLFFTQGKVACTEFKKLLRRMMHKEDWWLHKEPKLPHDPRYNGLAYLYQFPLPEARTMLTHPDWTRAIFVRDPKERLLSAFLDKAAKKDGLYVDRHCCPVASKQGGETCGKVASQSLTNFLELIQKDCCCDPHWKPQSQRIDQELWPYINFVGRFENLAGDTRRLLETLNVWEQYGASGWGEARNESAFVAASTSKHKTNADTKMKLYFNDSRVAQMAEDIYKGDYELFQYEKNA
eukprot:Nitzschia sp. Nitz4//scaffold69_size99277//67484//68688//NITZ4_004639-RA/size99277-augustus-gene-0.22-mRNA-1//1//CDS//3329556733//2437//frame0